MAGATHRAHGSGASFVAGVRVSHADRVVFPDCGVTKLELARYWERHAERILPHVAGQPLTLLLCPRAIGDGCYFMKHSNVWAPGGARADPHPREGEARRVPRGSHARRPQRLGAEALASAAQFAL